MEAAGAGRAVEEEEAVVVRPCEGAAVKMMAAGVSAGLAAICSVADQRPRYEAVDHSVAVEW